MTDLTQEKRDEIISTFRIFDISKIENYGDKLNDHVLFSLVKDNPALFLKLESYMSDWLYYQFLQYMNGHDELAIIIAKMDISVNMERILINIFSSPKIEFHQFYKNTEACPNNEGHLYLVEKSMMVDAYTINLWKPSNYINLYTLAEKLIYNKKSSFQLINHVHDMLMRSDSTNTNRNALIKRAKLHPNFSAAGAILKEMAVNN